MNDMNQQRFARLWIGSLSGAVTAVAVICLAVPAEWLWWARILVIIWAIGMLLGCISALRSSS